MTEDRFPPIEVEPTTWSLGANPRRMDESAQAWRALSKALDARADDLVSDTRRLNGSEWSGQARDTFIAYRDRLVTSLDEAREKADKIGREIEAMQDLFSRYQAELTAIRGDLTRRVRANEDGTRFHPESKEQATTIDSAVGEARARRDDLERRLETIGERIPGPEWEKILTDWQAVAENKAEPFAAPGSQAGSTVMMVDGRMMVDTGSGNEKIAVRLDANGKPQLIIDGVPHTVPDGVPLTIRAGAGNDTITVDPGVNLKVSVLGGDGQDRITTGGGDDVVIGGHDKDTIFAGAGADYVSAGSGHDYVDGQDGDDAILGGLGNDTLYGLGGKDDVSGGDGRDYLEGGKGEDSLDGGAARDVLSGGRDADHLHGGQGQDVMYGGLGKDTYSSGGGGDITYKQQEDIVRPGLLPVNVEITGVPGFIQVVGAPEFQERVVADLEMYAASPTAQQMFGELQRLHEEPGKPPNSVYIEETEEANADAATASRSDQATLYRVRYNPGFTFDHESGRPATVLYHEFGHVYDGITDGLSTTERVTVGPDAGQRIDELQATGIRYDWDGDGTTTVHPHQRMEFTENGLRREMLQPLRNTYIYQAGDEWD